MDNQQGLYSTQNSAQCYVAAWMRCNLRTEWLRTTNVCYLGVDMGMECGSGVAGHQAPSPAASHLGVIISFTFLTF